MVESDILHDGISCEGTKTNASFKGTSDYLRYEQSGIINQENDQTYWISYGQLALIWANNQGTGMSGTNTPETSTVKEIS